MLSKTTALASLTLAAMLAAPSAAQASQWELDASHSRIGFKVRHMMVTNTRGQFSKFTGTVNLDDKNPVKSSVELSIDVDSIDTADEKRDGHLKSPDFFDAAKFPKMTFKSTKIEKAGKGYKVTGDLTIRDVTKPVTLTVEGPAKPAKDPWGNMRSGVSATGVINRKDFGLTWNAALETGGVAVGEEVTLEIEVELMQKPAAAPAPATK
ncbi:YceI family protein [Myxococcota bacterium]|nr:YceI family protein [Myxococcota bacterium]